MLPTQIRKSSRWIGVGIGSEKTQFWDGRNGIEGFECLTCEKAYGLE